EGGVGDGDDSLEIFVDQNSVADVAVANERFELAAIAPGCFMQIVSGKEDAAGGERLAIPQNAQSLDRGGCAPLHVARSTSGDAIFLNFGRDEGKVNCVEMPIELQRAARLATVDAHGDGRR